MPSKEDEDPSNQGTLMIDATCVPTYIKFLQDIGLLNDARLHAEKIVDEICEAYDFSKPRMCQNKTHSVPNRIVSFHQPYLRPIVRGKAKASTEFGAKLDVSQAEGFLRIERLSFDAFNESEDLIPAVERYKERTGHYPERVLADQIYRTRANRKFCKESHIRLSGPKLGRSKKDQAVDKK